MHEPALEGPPPPESRARNAALGHVRRVGLDGVIVANGVAAQVELWTVPGADPRALLIPFAAAWGFGLLARHRYPFWAQVGVIAAAALQSVLLPGTAASMATLFVAGAFIAWTLGAELPAARAAVGAVLLVGLDLLVALTADEEVGIGGVLVPIAVFGIVFTAGLLSSQRARTAAALVERAQLLEQQRHERQAAAVAEERARIARELHDVVAHGLSVIAVQAGAAQEILPRDPERARAALAAVEATARDALGEMRRLLGVLRADGEAAGRAPQPDVRDLEDLVASVRRAGLPVELEVTGTPGDVPAGVGLAAYRIVQEALTNTLRHAGPARAVVWVRHEPGVLRITVEDDGTGVGGAARRGEAGGGHGLAGMRERAALYGGTVEAGPRPEGGFAVRAVLPVPEVTPP